METARNLPARPSAPALWSRLDQPRVLATEDNATPDGRIHRTALVQVQGKYSRLVFEGLLPAGRKDAENNELTGAIAKVADHLVVRPASGVSSDEFRAAMAAAGLTVRENLSPDGGWLVSLPAASLHGVDEAIAKLSGNRSVAYAEPDYLVHASDIPGEDVVLEMVDGQLVRSDSLLPVGAGEQAAAPASDPVTLEADQEQRLQALPAGARVIGFDAPYFLGGPASYDPYLEEQNFVVGCADSTYVQGAYTSGYPNNGSYYLRSMGYSDNVTIRHRENLPFAMLSVDLAEYSTTFATPTNITFTGYKANGGTVTKTFTTDGVIDGTGVAEDFQHFTFDAGFSNLKSVVVSGPHYMVDNIGVQVDGQESSPPASPEPPLLYDVTFDAPKHTAGLLTAVSGAYAPSSINFGTPTIRPSIGDLDGQALELKGSGYQQIRFGVRQQAAAYRLEFDAWLDLQTDFSVLFDGAATGGAVQKFMVKPNGSVDVYQISSTFNYPAGISPRTKTRIAVDIDMAAGRWEFFVNGVSKWSRSFVTTGGDVQDIRFHTADTGSGLAGFDNIRIYAYGTSSGPTTGPRLIVSPGSLAFPSLPIGTSRTWYLDLRNNGSQPLTVQSAVSSSSQFLVTPPGTISILPGGSFSVPVTYKPTVMGLASGTVTITSNDPSQPVCAVPVTGTGQGVPVATLSPLTLDVSMVAGTSGTRTFNLANTGAANLNWNLVLKGVGTDAGTPTDQPVSPNDPMLSSEWALRAPSSGSGGIDALHAWAVSTGGTGAVIAVIDTGVDRSHPELQGNLWTNTGEIPNNGIDDDHNGYIDDVNGWDFANNDALPADGHGHGTHVAGTIAARGNNAAGVSGVCWSARIMPVKFLADNGSGYTSDAVKAVAYATRMGAKISNNSWGGGGYSQALYDAINQAAQAGDLFVASAGNDAADNDVTPQYPSSYQLPNVVSVASTDERDNLSYFSNRGAATVDIAAPGSNILSLQPGGGYASKSGTSMAAPHVAGVAGLLVSKNPSLTPSQIKQLLMFGSDSLGSLGGKVASQGRLNAYKALKSVLPSWLKPQVTAGTLLAGASANIPLTVDTTSLGVGTYTQVIALNSNDPIHPNLTLPVVLKVIPNVQYSSWLAANFTSDNMLANDAEGTLWADVADADGDGVSNLLEYLTGNDPTARNPKSVTSAAGNVFEFQARPGDPNVSYQIEWSESLSGGWRTDRVQVLEDSTTGTPAGVHRLRVRISDPQPAAAFFRLSARRNF
ncbi:S8 family serine peptidase [Luteolibacter ambystomatis]